MLTHRNVLMNAYYIGRRLRYTADDRVCVPVPFYHCFGCVLGTLVCAVYGSALVVPAPSFDAGRDARGGRRRALHVALRRARRCSWPSSTTPTAPGSTCRACGPGSWRGARARCR